MSTEKSINANYVKLTHAIPGEQNGKKERIDIPIKYIHHTNSGLFPNIEATLKGHLTDHLVGVIGNAIDEEIQWRDTKFSDNHNPLERYF